ncbi:hypothetical protein GCM10018953_17850 [Streptosporangium nondiastaticum]
MAGTATETGLDLVKGALGLRNALILIREHNDSGADESAQLIELRRQVLPLVHDESLFTAASVPQRSSDELCPVKPF